MYLDKMASRHQTTCCLVVFAVALCTISFGMYGIYVDKELVQHLQQPNEEFKFVSYSDILHFQKGTFNVNQHDSLIRYIKGRIIGPSKERYTLQQKTRRYFSQADQDKFVDDTLHHLRNGFFVECGAAEGESLSNTIFLEKYRNWTGLLIEANPQFYSKILQKNRKSYSIHACLSLGNVPKLMKFKPVGVLGGIAGTMDETHLKAIKHQKAFNQEVAVQCFPFHYIMESLGRNHINYLSLDIEGPELEVLQTIPWKKLRIDIISIEYRLSDMKNINVDGSKIKLNKIRKFMLETGLYEEAKILPENSNDANGLDVVFKRRDLSV